MIARDAVKYIRTVKDACNSVLAWDRANGCSKRSLKVDSGAMWSHLEFVSDERLGERAVPACPAQFSSAPAR